MIKFDKFTLKNGLRVIVHHDPSTPVAAFNILYDVGARDEDENKTGFAHLFEHLMFGGSVNIPDFDKPLQERGGSSNAFTNNDITNYYITIPKENLETAFWLDSDRLLSLAFSEKSLEVQRQVVVEEYKQRYLNQPYGDVWLLMRPLAYHVHPYKWPTIGKEIAHIENAVLDDVKNFFYKHYGPENAILCVAGNVTTEEIKQLSEKWFNEIPSRGKYVRNLPKEPEQKEARRLTVKRNVPVDAIYKMWHVGKRNSPEFYPTDLITDILSRGNSSRLYRELVQNKKYFSEIGAYVSGELDEGMLVISGKINKGIDPDVAEKGILNVIEDLKNTLMTEDELTKVVNKWESAKLFEDMSVMNKATNLCYFELLGDAEMINQETAKYQAVRPADIQHQAQNIFKESNCSTLHYLSEKN